MNVPGRRPTGTATPRTPGRLPARRRRLLAPPANDAGGYASPIMTQHAASNITGHRHPASGIRVAQLRIIGQSLQGHWQVSSQPGVQGKIAESDPAGTRSLVKSFIRGTRRASPPDDGGGPARIDGVEGGPEGACPRSRHDQIQPTSPVGLHRRPAQRPSRSTGRRQHSGSNALQLHSALGVPAPEEGPFRPSLPRLTNRPASFTPCCATGQAYVAEYYESRAPRHQTACRPAGPPSSCAPRINGRGWRDSFR